MKCPKCNYLGFERVDRCRNCGYDFSLSHQVPEPDFAIWRDTGMTTGEPDLSLDRPPGDWTVHRTTDIGADLDRLLGVAEPESVQTKATPPPRAAAQASSRAEVREELPLFGPPIPDDEPLITRASPPRPPLAVRRATPEVPRLRTETPLRTPTFDLAPETPDRSPLLTQMLGERVVTDADAQDHTQDAGIARRLLAALVDLVILAVIDVVVVYFTMQLCYLTIDDVGILPKGPLLAFLLVQNGGYLVAFTAGGQTLGKMMAGIRVVQSDSARSLDLGHAFLRTFMWVVLAVPAGLGFLTTLFSRDHRGLHDRFAGTRVVRASV